MRKKVIFVINGRATAGKDTFVKLFTTVAEEYNLTVENISSVDGTKALAKQMGWDGEKTDKSRKFLAELKFLWKDFNNGPFEQMKAAMLDSYATYMFFHVRELDEIAELCALSGMTDKYGIHIEVKSLYINRDVELVTNNEADLAAASPENFPYDIIIDNNSDIETLQNRANLLFSRFS